MHGTLKHFINLALAQKIGKAIKPSRNPVRSDYIPHYCYIFDKSEDGNDALRAAKLIIDGGLSNRLSSKVVIDWTKSRYPYIVIHGSWGYTGGTAIFSSNLKAMLSNDLPKIMGTIKNKGGLCSFVVGTKKSEIAQIQAVLAKLQPQEV